MLLLLSRFSLLLSVLFLAPNALAISDGKESVEVIGVITSGEAGQGIALVKTRRDGKTFAKRVGELVEDDLMIEKVERNFVYFKSATQTTRVRVGEAYSAPSPYAIKFGEGGIERKGNEVRMTTAYRDLVLKRQLGKVLMQAAAVPYYVNGELSGFRLWEIDEGSVFEQAGFMDGDIVTQVNGQRLTDVGMTVRMLQSMRDEPRADVTFVRKGAEQTVTLVVQ